MRGPMRRPGAGCGAGVWAAAAGMAAWLVCGGVALAQDPAPAAGSAEEYLVRDPFWPVGYVPQVIQAVAQQQEDVQAESEKTKELWDEAQEQLTIAGISDMGPAGLFAVINGRMTQASQIVSIQYKGYVFEWRVTEITPRGVRFTPVGVNPAAGRP